ncbi:MAG: type II toxin-antitoxin system VapC family toxin [Spirochaetaceae bacterium]|nr:type II toxin-antitoxin system VapC family toxin [Spirochaetaceae bacterium]
MVIDTSAIIAILFEEPECDRIATAIATSSKHLISAFTALECGIVIEAKKGESGGRELDILFHKLNITIVNMDSKQYEIARKAWRLFGKGRHPAKLNIGDCCSYALSAHSGEPLLFKGDDFSQTDIKRVEY